MYSKPLILAQRLMIAAKLLIVPERVKNKQAAKTLHIVGRPTSMMFLFFMTYPFAEIAWSIKSNVL